MVFRVRSPWNEKKVSGREGENSALPPAEGRREGDRICPALTETFMSLHLIYMDLTNYPLLLASWGLSKDLHIFK
jgi:hypothetical protein